MRGCDQPLSNEGGERRGEEAEEGEGTEGRRVDEEERMEGERDGEMGGCKEGKRRKGKR